MPWDLNWFGGVHHVQKQWCQEWNGRVAIYMYTIVWQQWNIHQLFNRARGTCSTCPNHYENVAWHIITNFLQIPNFIPILAVTYDSKTYSRIMRSPLLAGMRTWSQIPHPSWPKSGFSFYRPSLCYFPASDILSLLHMAPLVGTCVGWEGPHCAVILKHPYLHVHVHVS